MGKKNLGKRKAANINEENLDCWEMNAKFKNITYWNHDNLPSQDDAFLRSFHWLSVAKSVSFYSFFGDKKTLLKSVSFFFLCQSKYVSF